MTGSCEHVWPARSSWLGPPNRKTAIHDFALPKLDGAVEPDERFSSDGSSKPALARPPSLPVVGPALMILQTGIFGSKRREWPRQEIARTCVGPSGATFND